MYRSRRTLQRYFCISFYLFFPLSIFDMLSFCKSKTIYAIAYLCYQYSIVEIANTEYSLFRFFSSFRSRISESSFADSSSLAKVYGKAAISARQ